MKFTFICIVIVISCSVCACNDLDIYSDDVPDDDNDEDLEAELAALAGGGASKKPKKPARRIIPQREHDSIVPETLKDIDDDDDDDDDDVSVEENEPELLEESNALEGLYDFNKPRAVPRLPEYDRPSYYSKYRYPFENVLPDDYDDRNIRDPPEYREYNSIPDKIRQYQEVIDWELNQLHKHRPRHETPPVLQYYLDKLNKPERFELDIPTLSRAEETRMYPSDDDLQMKSDDKTDETDNMFDDDGSSDNDYGTVERLIPNEIATERIEEELPQYHHHIVHPNDKDTVEFTTTRFKNVKVVDNPSEFAYSPSDPRFYRKIELATEKTTKEPTTTTTRTTTKSPKFKQFDLETEKLKVNPRSDHKIAPSEKLFQDISSKDESIEVVPIHQNLTDGDSAGVYVIAIVAGISAAATVGLIAVGIGWYNLQKHVKNASDVEYPTYGVTGPNKDISPTGGRRLAQSAQMYHYQHQKQQVIAAVDRAPPGERHGSVSEAESDEENEEGDYTVYECPGLAPTGEMEVKNPLFQDDPTPAQTPANKTTSTNTTTEEEKK